MSAKTNKVRKLIRIIVIAIILGILVAGSGLFYIYSRYSKDLPDYEKLKSYHPLITTRLYSSDGELIKEFSKENRVFVSIHAIPKNLINAFLAAEDSNFYKHSGIDFSAIIRAAIDNAISYSQGTGMKGGASTITQQVVKNFLLTNERTITRKIKEAILAFKITKQFTKDQILELYLNQIYLGASSYGVASAAQAYFDKSIDDLSIGEVALLATLPKAPSKLDPRKNIKKAKIRRDWVIDRMAQEGFINYDEAKAEKEQPITLKDSDKTIEAKANAFADTVKKQLSDLYGSDNVFESGIVVRTTIDTKLQQIARFALQNGIEAYDRRHGYRGAITNIKIKNNWLDKLEEVEIEDLYKDSWQKAVILDLQKEEAKIGLDNEDLGIIKLEDITWAKKYINVDNVGSEIKKMSDVFKVGDVILVKNINKNIYSLKQIPKVNGGVMAMNPHSGEVLAMMGSYIDAANQFNRSIQAKRQPGSVLKTFGYLAALENGLNPATIIMDEPITLDQGDDKLPYSPVNYSRKFYGPTTLRSGLERSINVTTVRAAAQVGLPKVVDVIKKFKINDTPEPIYSLVLGSTETTLSKLVSAYSTIVNGGKEVSPIMIEKIQDRNGKNIFKSDERDCNCDLEDPKKYKNLNKIPFPILKDKRNQITDSATAYQVTSMLEGAVKRGTGYKASKINNSIGGKTGTTDNSYDSWFVGFSPDLVFGVYIGFDIPQSLGKYETGSSIALPIFVEFMTNALKDEDSTPFRVPDDVKFVKIDRLTGRAPTPSTPKYRIIFEALKLNDKIEGGLNYDSLDEESDDEFEEEQDIGIY